ncbi:hypothetical protein J5W64_00105 [Candidatus Akkermansia timonensis]|nr:hypothetical protein [Candidatus Akkermansia timonensis]QWO90852.1 hypothetical protein J5W64_00105 [Candidatus Akkermansia timonensis]
MMRQPQIIVAGQIHHFTAVFHAGHPAGQTLHIPQGTQQPGGLQLG